MTPTVLTMPTCDALEPGQSQTVRISLGSPVVVDALRIPDHALRRDEGLEAHASVKTMLEELLHGSEMALGNPTFPALMALWTRSHNQRRRALRERRRRLRLAACLVVESIVFDDRVMSVGAIHADLFSESVDHSFWSFLSSATTIAVTFRNIGTWRTVPFRPVVYADLPQRIDTTAASVALETYRRDFGPKPAP